MTAIFTSFGVLSAVCFGFCTLPSILLVLKRKSTSDISMLFILMSLIGNLSAASYIVYSNIVAGFYQWPQYLNYSFATALVIILLALKIKYDKEILKMQIRRCLSRIRRRYLLLQYSFADLIGDVLFASAVIGMLYAIVKFKLMSTD